MVNLSSIAEWVIFIIDFAAVAIVSWACALALYNFIRIEFFYRRAKETKFLEKLRVHFGQKLLLGIEFFLAADLVRVVVNGDTTDAIIRLGAIVIIRTILSFFLNIEIRDIKNKWGSKVWQESLRK